MIGHQIFDDQLAYLSNHSIFAGSDIKVRLKDLGRYINLVLYLSPTMSTYV